MAQPDAFCSENCGLGDLVPEFLFVWTNVPAPFYREYNRGKIFQYFGQEPDDRCVWFPIEPSSFWNFEKISRYPEGWNFPPSQPVPGKWTWRLSVDRFPFPDLPFIPPPYILNGWKENFDRVDDDTVNPNHTCVTDQTLNDYAHFGFFPPAYIRPLTETAQPPKIKNKAGPCFCADECPPTTRPYRKYLIEFDGTNHPAGYEGGKLYELAEKVDRVCRWNPVEPSSGFVLEVMEKDADIPRVQVDNVYVMRLQIHDGTTLWAYENTYTWNDENDQGRWLNAQCHQRWVLPAMFGTSPARLVPVPDWICTDEEAIEWWAWYQSVA